MANKKPHRLDKIYTRSGDSGKTSLALGERLYKHENHIQVLGEIDELNCQIGIVSALLSNDQPLINDLKIIQNSLFDIGAQLAMNSSEFPAFKQSFIDDLEQKLDLINQQIPPLKDFILPGGSLSAAQCHLARAVCRRAERQFVKFVQESQQHQMQEAPENRVCFDQPIKYINRLSDYLFVLARYLNKIDQHAEILWQPNR
jgi:cob(I)alamin adenosyltransferase